MGGLFDKLWKTIVMYTAQLLGLFVVPVALLFCSREDEHLPHWAYPWCNEWDSINGYSNRGHWEARWGSATRSYWPRFLWLAIRNRAANTSQWLGKESPEDSETWRLNILIPYTTKALKCQWGYTSYYPGSPGTCSLRVMPKRNFKCTASLRDRSDL